MKRLVFCAARTFPIYQLKQRLPSAEGYEYLQREYGIKRGEWDRFVRRREEEIEADRAQGRMKLFTGNIEARS